MTNGQPKTMKANRHQEMEIKVNITDISPIGKSKQGEDCFAVILDTGQALWITESNVSIHPVDIILYSDDEKEMAIRRMMTLESK